MNRCSAPLLGLLGIAVGWPTLVAPAPLRAEPDPQLILLCQTDATTLCLESDTVSVTATFQTSNGSSGQAHAEKITDETGYFWFFTSTNVEAVVKIVPACGVNRKLWFFAGGLTNVEVNITVTQKQTAQVMHYTNPLNTAFKPIQDTNSLDCPITSSARFKDDVRDMPDLSADLRRLQTSGTDQRHEEAPEPLLVPRQELPAILLDVLQNQALHAARQKAELDELHRQVERLLRQLEPTPPSP